MSKIRGSLTLYCICANQLPSPWWIQNRCSFQSFSSTILYSPLDNYTCMRELSSNKGQPPQFLAFVLNENLSFFFLFRAIHYLGLVLCPMGYLPKYYAEVEFYCMHFYITHVIVWKATSSTTLYLVFVLWGSL